MENKYKVAVYGSLRKGLYNHYLMSHSDFIKTISVEVPFKMISMSDRFPALIPTKENNLVVFELYKIDDKTARNLDILEGYPDFYSKKYIKIEDEDYLVYYLSPLKITNEEEVVKSGDWTEFKHKKLSINKES
jgi:gamma-glutamylaminecyclotransferase